MQPNRKADNKDLNLSMQMLPLKKEDNYSTTPGGNSRVGKTNMGVSPTP